MITPCGCHVPQNGATKRPLSLIVRCSLFALFVFQLACLISAGLADLARAALFAALGGSLALAARLWAFVVRAAARFGKYTILLDFAVKAFERLLKRISWIYFYFTHKLLPTRSSIITSARLLRLKAIITINGLVAAGLEWHLRLVTAVGTNNGIHLARFARATTAAAMPTGGLPYTRGTA